MSKNYENLEKSQNIDFCNSLFFRDFSRFSEEWQLFDVGRFEGVTFLRPSDVRPMYVTKLPMFGGLDGVRAPRHGPCNCAQNSSIGP